MEFAKLLRITIRSISSSAFVLSSINLIAVVFKFSEKIKKFFSPYFLAFFTVAFSLVLICVDLLSAKSSGRRKIDGDSRKSGFIGFVCICYRNIKNIMDMPFIFSVSKGGQFLTIIRYVRLSLGLPRTIMTPIVAAFSALLLFLLRKLEEKISFQGQGVLDKLLWSEFASFSLNSITSLGFLYSMFFSGGANPLVLAFFIVTVIWAEVKGEDKERVVPASSYLKIVGEYKDRIKVCCKKSSGLLVKSAKGAYSILGIGKANLTPHALCGCEVAKKIA